MAIVTFPLSAAVHAANAAPRKSLLARFFEAMMAARMRQAMRELERYPHLLPRNDIEPVEYVPQDEVKRAGYRATFADAGLLPFVRGA